MSLENTSRPLDETVPLRPSALATPKGAARHRWTIGGFAFSGISQIFLIIWAILVIFPFVWMLVASFKTSQAIFFNPWGLPKVLQWSNFSRAWTQASIGRYFLNSIVVVGCGVFLTLLLSAMAAYVLARFEFPGRGVVYYGFLIGLMFPVFLALVPLFFVVRDLHMLNTYQGLILVYVAYSFPFSIFFMTGFFRTLPNEVAEAAIVDGASQYRIFFNIMLPMAKSGIIAIGIFNFLGQWNQFILPLVLNSNQSRYVLSQGIAFLAINQGYQNDYGALFAGLTITTIPTLVVYILFQKRLESGLTAGALKG